MKTIEVLKRVLKPPILRWLGFIIFSIIFVTGYFVIGYQSYQTNYKTTQFEEIMTVHRKAELALKQLNDFLDLTASLISTSLSTITKMEQAARIQEILKSCSSLKLSFNLPSIQKVAFYKISQPPLYITRFNILPLTSADLSFQDLISVQFKSELTLQSEAIVGRLKVANSKGINYGLLEIQVDLSDFIQFLGTYQTIQLKEPVESRFLLDKIHLPFLLAKNAPLPFQTYSFSLLFDNWMVILYLLFCQLLLGIGSYVFYKYINKNLLHTIQVLKESISTLKTTETVLTTTVSKQKSDYEAYVISQQAHRKYNFAMVEKMKNQAKILTKCLEVIKANYNSLPDETINIQMERGLKQTKALSNGLWIPSNADNIEMREIIKNFNMLFAEKLHQSNIHIDVKDFSHLPPFKGDAFLIEVLLINILGKVVYRVPDQGIVIISAKKMPGYLHLQIQDTGFGRVIQAEKIIQKSSGLFIDEQDFKKLCKENGVYVKFFRTNDGHNITQVLLPVFNSPCEGEKNNVVQLFS